MSGPAGSLEVRADVLQAPAPSVAELLHDQVITVVDGVITDMSPASALGSNGPTLWAYRWGCWRSVDDSMRCRWSWTTAVACVRCRRSRERTMTSLPSGSSG